MENLCGSLGFRLSGGLGIFQFELSHSSTKNPTKMTRSSSQLQLHTTKAQGITDGGWNLYLEDGLPFSKWLVTMVSKSPK